MSRFYCPQWCDSMKGWLDIPSKASTGKKVADDFAKDLAERYHVVARAIRKPKGWNPNGKVDTLPHISDRKKERERRNAPVFEEEQDKNISDQIAVCPCCYEQGLIAAGRKISPATYQCGNHHDFSRASAIFFSRKDIETVIISM